MIVRASSGLNYAWRVVATGFCFLTFSCMGLAFRFLACPYVNLTARSPRERELKARRIVQRSFDRFVLLMQRLGVLQWRVRGRERLRDGGQLVCPSHPTLIDVVLMMSMISNANCIVKADLKRSFAMSSPIVTTGYIANDSGPALIEACTQSLNAGDTLIIFPEGTRTRPGKEPKLHHGAAATALSARMPITPVVITCTPPSLMKGIPWYRIPPSKMSFEIDVLEPIDIEPYLSIERQQGRPIAIRRLTEALKSALFNKSFSRI